MKKNSGFDSKKFVEALSLISEEKGIPKEKIISAMKNALAKHLKKQLGKKDEDIKIEVEVDDKKGGIEIFYIKTVVEEVLEPETEISLEEARKDDPEYEVGDEWAIPYEPDDFGRIAAKFVKDDLIAEIRKLNQEIIYDKYIDRKENIITGMVQRFSGPTVYVAIGEDEAVMPKGERVFSERLKRNTYMRFLVKDVTNDKKDVLIILTRKSPEFIEKLFEEEVPELREGVVEIVGIVREAGERTKMAVKSNDPDVDPVGTFIGNRGIRVGAVVDEVFGEKIDVISWSDDMQDNIKQALSPAKVETVRIEEGKALVVVPDEQKMLAIGRDSQNVRLAAYLLELDIDIKGKSEVDEDGNVLEVPEEKPEEKSEETATEKFGEETPLENSEEIPKEKPEEKSEETPEEQPEEQSEEQPSENITEDDVENKEE